MTRAQRDLPDDGTPDPVLTDVLPGLWEGRGGTCPCGCGEPARLPGGAGLPALRAAPDDDLAALAAASPLVRRAVALAGWLGSGRAVTSGSLLRPADAARAVGDLGLNVRLLPRADVQPTDGTGGDAGSRKTRSAKRLPHLHALWCACVESQLIGQRGGRAVPGPGLAVWLDEADAAARLESWAALLAGLLRARDDAARANQGLFDGIGQPMLESSVPLLYAQAREPVPVGELALAISGLDDDPDLDVVPRVLVMLPSLVAELNVILEDWLAAGVLELRMPAAEDPYARELSELRRDIGEQLDLAVLGPAARRHVDGLRQMFGDVLSVLERTPVVQLTALGEYGLARLLAAHGWEVPRSGGCRDLPAGELLDRLAIYAPGDLGHEAATWLAARGDDWAEALQEVISSAASMGPEGPARRATLVQVLVAAGPRAVPGLDVATRDPGLDAIAAAARQALGLGPQPTLAQRLWLAVDALSAAGMDRAADPVAQADVLTWVGLPALLAEAGGVQAAAMLAHPAAGDALRACIPHLDDPQIARSLRKALFGAVPGAP